MAIVFVVLEHSQPQCAFRTEKAAYSYAEEILAQGKAKANSFRIVPCELYGENKPAGTGIPFDDAHWGSERSQKG
jgi:hypothetical protein